MFNTIQQDIKAHLDEGRILDAYAIWTEISGRISQGEDAGVTDSAVREMQREIRRAAEARLRDLGNAMDTGLAPGSNALLTDLENQLDEYTRLMPIMDRGDAQGQNLYVLATEGYQRRVDKKQKDAFYAQEYRRVKAEVDDLHQQARQISIVNSDISETTLLELYKQAVDVASEAAAASPENVRLGGLLETATKERERIANEKNAMTSGAQADDFVTTLDTIERANDAEGIMVYDLKSQPVGRKPKAEAKAFVVAQARELVNSRMATYIDDAERQVAVNNPRVAQAAIGQYMNKFGALAERIPNLLNQTNTDSYDNVRKRINALLAEVDKAERAAASAETEAEKNPVGAWKTFWAAKNATLTSTHSTEIARIEGVLMSALRRHLNTQYDRLQHEYTAERLADVQSGVEAVLLPLKDAVFAGIENWGEHSQLVGLGELAKTRQTRKETAARELTDADALKKSDEALRRLENTEQTYNDVIRFIPAYDGIASRIRVRSNAEREYERLRAVLASNHIESVRKARDAALSAANTVTEQSDRFNLLADHLGQQIAFLDALALPTQGEIKNALDDMAARPLLEESVKTRVTKKRDELAGEIAQLAANREVLQAARVALDSQPPAFNTAWRGLAGMSKFRDGDERESWAALVRRSVNALTIDTTFDSSLLTALLNTVDETSIDPDSRLRARTRVIADAQYARDLMNSSQWENAFQKWDALEKPASGTDRDYIIGMKQRAARMRHAGIVDALRLKTAAAIASPDLAGQLIRDIEDEIEMLTRDAAAWQASPIESADAGIWQTQLYLLMAGIAIDTAGRDAALKSAATLAADLPTRVDKAKRAARQSVDATVRERVAEFETFERDALVLAQHAGRLASTLRQIEFAFVVTADPGFLKAALDEWGELQTACAQTNDFHLFQARCALYRERFQDALRVQIATLPANTRLTADQLRWIACALLLDPAQNDAPALRSRVQEQAGRTRDHLDKMLRGLPTAQWPEGIAGKTNMQILRGQREALAEVAGQLAGLLALYEALPGVLATGDDHEQLTYTLASGKQMMENLLPPFVEIERAADTLSGSMENTNAGEPWETYPNDLRGQLDGFEATLTTRSREASDLIDRQAGGLGLSNELAGSMRQLPSRHMQIVAVRLLMNKLITEVENAVTALVKLRKAIQTEDMQTAADLLTNTLPTHAAVLEKRGLWEVFFVIHPLTNEKISGEAAIRGHVTRQVQAWGRITAWADSFARNFSPSFEDAVQGGDAMLQETTATLDWANWTDGLMLLRSRARFEAEKILLGYLLTGVGDLGHIRDTTTQPDEKKLADDAEQAVENGTRTLQQAYEATQGDFPLADQEAAYTANFEEARARAQSLRGRYVLDQINKQRFKAYAANLKAAQDYQTNIAAVETRWNEAETRFNAAYSTLTDEALQPKRGLFGGGGVHKATREAVATCIRELITLNGIASEKAAEMQNRPTLAKARQVTGL